jgi:cell division protein FtsW (lipid II flippase)
MLYPDDLAYLVFAIQDARDHGKMVAADFHNMPPFVFDYLMTARLFYTMVAVAGVYVCYRLVRKMWRSYRWTWLMYCGAVGLTAFAVFMQIVQAYQAWAHPVEWMTRQFIQFN